MDKKMSDKIKRMGIVIIAIIVILFFLGIGMKFFLKERGSEDILDQNIKQTGQQIKTPKKVEKTELNEKEKLKLFAENFAVVYYSYNWGNFSNIESLYDFMSERMRSGEKDRVAQIKKEVESQQKYLSARTRLVESIILTYNEKSAEIFLNLEITNFTGAVIQKETIIWVDGNGNPYFGDTNNLIIGIENKKIKINFIKTDEKWTVNEIINIE